ncbi:MAG: PhnD/SsuA/transferrin family substrate-binding protein, partial [Anaerolineales bacterium]|nr:PhnD/SsuA/transferrin family substrate-binding protein [Anaerolineales bacterium]
MNKRLFFVMLTLIVSASMILSACTPAATEAPVVTEAPAPTEAPVATEAPAPELGSPENPLIMALAPSATTQELQTGGEAIAAKLTELTGFTITTTVPTNYAAMIEAMGAGNAHIGWL